MVIEFSWNDPYFPFAVGLDSMDLANKTQFQIHVLAGVFEKHSTFLNYYTDCVYISVFFFLLVVLDFNMIYSLSRLWSFYCSCLIYTRCSVNDEIINISNWPCCCIKNHLLNPCSRWHLPILVYPIYLNNFQIPKLFYFYSVFKFPTQYHHTMSKILQELLRLKFDN